MRGRGGLAGMGTSPTMVGAVTVLVTIVAVFLAYNANNGLPFVPTYRLYVELPDANTLVRGNEVRIGGVRVGRVSSVTAQRDESGHPVAVAEIELNKQVEPLPVDSTVMVRSRSAIALKYLEITPGDSERGFEPGATIPESAARPQPVELDEVVNTFDPETRRAMQENLLGFGDALAGRGVSLNEIFGALPQLARVAEPVAATLARPSTRFGEFWQALAATASEVAPVAATQAELFENLDTTFAAFAEVARPYLQQTIERSPGTLDEANRSLPALRPFLAHSREFLVAFEPGAQTLAETSPEIARALAAGSRVLPRTPRVNEQLAPAAEALLAFQEADGVEAGIDLLIDANRELEPSLRFLAPAQTTCNYLTLLFRNAGSIGAVGDGRGNWTRFSVFTPPPGPNNEGSPASAPASGGPNPLNFLHYNPYPNTAAPGQPRECEAGNEIYQLGRQVIGNPSGRKMTGTEGQDVRLNWRGKEVEK